MQYLTAEQVKRLILKAREEFLQETIGLIHGDPVFPHMFRGKCSHVSIIVMRIVKDEYGIPDADNRITHGAIRIKNNKGIAHTFAHSYNEIGSDIVDATFDQFSEKLNMYLDPLCDYGQEYSENGRSDFRRPHNE